MRAPLLTLVLLGLLPNRGKSQSIANDFSLIQHSRVAPAPSKKHVNLYEKIIKAQLGTNCVYEMSCKEFSKELSKEFGPLKSIFLAIDRAGRCTHISILETLPPRLTAEGKIKEDPKDYRLHQ